MTTWVSAKEFLDALRAKAGASSHTFAICRRAHAGLLETRASSLIVSDGEPKRDEPIPRQFWWAEGHEALEQDWVHGDFSTQMDVRGRQIEVRALGVMFDKRDAEAMGAEFPPEPAVGLAAFDDGDRQVAEHWHRETWWPWIDAVVWIATRRPDDMKILAAYRALHMRSPGHSLINEQARFLVGQSLLKPSAMRAAEAELLAALRLGDVASRGGIAPDAALAPLDASEWTRLAPPTQLHTVALDADAGSVVFHNVRLSVADLLARWPITGNEEMPAPEVVAPRKPDEAKCDDLAALFDEKGIAIRNVSAELIAERWNLSDGPAPKKDVITSRMKGKPKGRRAGS